MADKPTKYLASHRKARGLTSEQLAKELGTTKPTISRLENGQMGPKTDWYLGRVASFYKISVDELLLPPVGNDSLTGVSQTRQMGENEEELMGPLTLQLQRLLQKYDYERIADKLDELEARRRAVPRPHQRRGT